MSTFRDLASALFNPSPLGLVIGILFVLTIPLFLHYFVFRASGITQLPSILLLGPSGTGKTALLTLFERGKPTETHTTQTPLAVECSLPVGTATFSDRYRSANDPSNKAHKKFLLLDTPGHGKLRHHALTNLTTAQNLKGLIFMVDSTTLSSSDEGLRQTADYLHDVLLVLQKRQTGSRLSKAPKEIPALIAANKMDLFTALPTALVRSALEKEIGRVRKSREKGLLDSGIGMDDAGSGEGDDWLGEMGSEEFKFRQLEEFNVTVEVLGGSVVGENESDVDAWWKWVGQRL